jgi:hypothetical protein
MVEVMGRRELPMSLYQVLCGNWTVRVEPGSSWLVGVRARIMVLVLKT